MLLPPTRHPLNARERLDNRDGDLTTGDRLDLPPEG